MNRFPSLFLLLSSLVLPGCITYHHTIRSEFPQAEMVEDTRREVEAAFVRSAKEYDQFATVGIFDALMLTDRVEEHVAHHHADRRGHRSEKIDKRLEHVDRQKKEAISFYLLAEFPGQPPVKLEQDDAAWTLSLMVDHNEQIPVSSIEEVTIPPEYRALFGQRFTPFKKQYKINFELKHAVDLKSIDLEHTLIELHCASSDHQVVLVWDPEIEPESVYEDIYWG